MPGDLGGTCGDYARVLFHFAREAAGAAAPPAFPAPSVSLGKDTCTTRAQNVPRECGGTPRVPGAAQHERSEMMRCRTGTHPFRSTNRSRFCEAALHAAPGTQRCGGHDRWGFVRILLKFLR